MGQCSGADPALPAATTLIRPTDRPSGEIANEKGSDVGGVTTSSRVTTGSRRRVAEVQPRRDCHHADGHGGIDATIDPQREHAQAQREWARDLAVRLTD